MKPQTDNSNIVVESLEDAARKYEKENNTFDWIEDNPSYIANKSFCDGANWKEEQLHLLIESHAELLEIAKTISFWFGNEANYPIGTNGYNIYQKAQKAISIANNLIK